jgi:single-strand DNA-binding protein
MASYNKVILMANFTRDPELRFLPSNTAICEFGLAVNDRYQNKQTQQWEDRPNFVDCTAFGKTAENIAKFFTKGRPIFIEGKLRFEQWEDKQSGQKRSKLKVVVDTWQFVDSDKGQGAGSTTGGAGTPSRGHASPPQQDNGWGGSDDDVPF